MGFNSGSKGLNKPRKRRYIHNSGRCTRNGEVHSYLCALKWNIMTRPKKEVYRNINSPHTTDCHRSMKQRFWDKGRIFTFHFPQGTKISGSNTTLIYFSPTGTMIKQARDRKWSRSVVSAKSASTNTNQAWKVAILVANLEQNEAA